jgi:hypothetical protein
MAHNGPMNALVAATLAEGDPASEIGPGLLAFAIVALLGLATFLLIRSMLHHLRKVPPSFEENPADESSDPDSRS